MVAVRCLLCVVCWSFCAACCSLLVVCFMLPVPRSLLIVAFLCGDVGVCCSLLLVASCSLVIICVLVLLLVVCFWLLRVDC